jgi:SNF2 family DNA or RNA helicase
MSEFLADQLDIINTVFKNSVEPKISNIVTPEIQKTLYQHQKNMIQMMYLHYLRMTQGFVWSNQLIHGKLGILGDPAGTGKTLTVLGFISLLKNSQPLYLNNVLCQGDLVEESNSYFYSNQLRSVSDISSTNLIIVPQHLYFQWKDEIQRSTTLSFFPIENRRILRNNTTPQLICSSDIVLITNKMYRYVQDFALEKNIRWKHVFMDEASTIHISSKEPKCSFDFLWLITNSWLGLLFRNAWITPSNLLHIRERFNLHPDCIQWLVKMNEQGGSLSTSIQSFSFLRQYIPYTHPCRAILVLINSQLSLQNSYTLPQINETTLECRQNYTITTLAQTPSLLTSTIKLPTILNSLGVRNYDISGLICDYPERNELIQTKAEDDCSICLDSTINRIFTTCCMNTFCGGCILRNIIISRVCPTCRAQINTDDIAFTPKQSDIQDISGQQILLSRQDTCVEYIKKHRNESIIIYTVFENTYYQILPELTREGIESDKLTPATYNRTVADFEAGRTKVIFTSNVDLIRGLNLIKAQHLIFFYEMAFLEQKQLLISSAQRLGRQTPLTVVQLRCLEQHQE